MRVIAGLAKGRQLKAPPGLETRPTADKIRGALFNILAPQLIDSHVLDLFAGTGALGIEALSRGAASAIFVERGAAALLTIKSNLELCRFTSQSQVIAGEVQRIIPRLRPTHAIDLIFMDPPYHRGLVEEALGLLHTTDYLAPQFVLVAEHHRNEELPDGLPTMDKTRVVTHGDTSLSFYRKRGI